MPVPHVRKIVFAFAVIFVLIAPLGEVVDLRPAVARASSAVSSGTPLHGDGRHRPGWIWSFVDWGGIKDEFHAVCKSGISAGGTVHESLSRAEPLNMCLRGFSVDDVPNLRLSEPDGTQVEMSGVRAEDDSTAWVWAWNSSEMTALFPHPGSYSFTVTAGSLPITVGDIDLQPALGESVVFSNEDPVLAGGAVIVNVFGRKPGSPIFASLYGNDQGVSETLVSDFPPVFADSYGEGVIRWPIEAGGLSGSYVVLVEYADADGDVSCSSRASCGEFQIEV